MPNETVPPSVVTDTATAPAACDGVTAVSWLELSTETLVAAVPPTRTVVAPATNVAPVSVMVVPPDVEPLAGATPVKVGAGVAPT